METSPTFTYSNQPQNLSGDGVKQLTDHLQRALGFAFPATANRQTATPDTIVSQPAQVPVMSAERFADLVGMKPGVIKGWCDRGHIPTLLIGRHRMVNIAALTQQCT